MPPRVWLVTLTVAAALVACAHAPDPTTQPELQPELQPEPQPDPHAAAEPNRDPEPPPPADPEPPTEAPAEADAQLEQTLRASIQAYLPDLQACYEAALRDDATLGGKMTYTITVESDGEVSGVVIEADTVNSDAVRACVRVEIESWVFERQPGTAASEVTFSAKFVAV